MNETIEILKEKLKKEQEKKTKAEDNIKKLEARIEQAGMTSLKAAMKEYNIDYAQLSELLKSGKIGTIIGRENEI